MGVPRARAIGMCPATPELWGSCGPKGAGGRLSSRHANGTGRVVREDRDAPIRVLLADDHTMFREGLAGILAAYGAMEVVAEVPNDAEALRLARELAPEVVVMQVQMPFERALETLSAMRSSPTRRRW